MNKPAAIQGTFADFKLVKTRQVAQFVVEVPLADADMALDALGGLPQPASERWVALAAINVTSIKPRQERRKFESLKDAMQAGIRCTEPAFWRFIRETWVLNPEHNVDDEESAARFVREYCGITSRSALNLDPKAAAKWQELDARFMVWMRAVG